MRYYEIVYLIHPNKSDNISGIIDNYSKIIKDDLGEIHRLEEWGIRKLAYKINKVDKAYYVLMNIKCSVKTIIKIRNSFKLDDFVIRNLIIKVSKEIKNDSFLSKGFTE